MRNTGEMVRLYRQRQMSDTNATRRRTDRNVVKVIDIENEPRESTLA